MTLEQEVDQVVAKFRGFAGVMQGEQKRIAALGGAYFAASAEAAAPTGNRVHKRYSTTKAVRSIRAPKGMGNVVATYMPGNLARSIRVLDLKRTQNAVYVGARLQKGSPSGTFSGMRADGYYMHMVEKGTRKWGGRPFFLSAWNRAKPMVEKIMTAEFLRVIEKYKTANGL
jgi:HK97 gp10 family phage protein